MVPRIARPGRSFKGAAAYYLHDKGAQTAERVAFTHTLNLPTDDPRRATAQMIDTATDAETLKQAAGLKAGRKLQTPVYAYSLAWDPSDRPSQEEQLQAARASLAALGMADRQALIVGHTDTAHPHVHVIVNRVCAQTGRAAATSNDRLKLSEWALAYAKERGTDHLTPERERNQDRRKGGQFAKHRPENRRSAYEWKKARNDALWKEYRQERDAAKEANAPVRAAQMDALWQQKEERFAVRRAEIKALYRPHWRDLFQRQREELRQFDTSIRARLSFARSQKTGVLALLFALTDDQRQRHAFLKVQEAERTAFADWQRQDVRDAGREITKAWKYDRDQLREAHRREDAGRLDRYKQKSDRIWQQEHTATRDFEQEAGKTVAQTQDNEQQPETTRKRKRTRKTARQLAREEQELSQGRTRTPE